MSIGHDTGRAEARDCAVCGVAVEHKEMIVTPPGTAYWRPNRHRCPSGAWCIGGGINRGMLEPGQSLRDGLKQAHRADGCARCDNKEKAA